MEIYSVKTMDYYHIAIQLNYNQNIYYTCCCRGKKLTVTSRWKVVLLCYVQF